MGQYGGFFLGMRRDKSMLTYTITYTEQGGIIG